MDKEVKEREVGPHGYVITNVNDYWEAILDYIAGGPMRDWESWAQMDNCERGMHLIAELEWLEHTAATMGFTEERLHRDINDEIDKRGGSRKLPALPKLPQREIWYWSPEDMKVRN